MAIYFEYTLLEHDISSINPPPRYLEYEIFTQFLDTFSWRNREKNCILRYSSSWILVTIHLPKRHFVKDMY